MEQISPEFARAARRTPQLPYRYGLLRRLARAGAARLPALPIDGVSAEDVSDDGASLRVYRPRDPTGAALVWIHGGGMVIGSPMQDERFCAQVASEGITVLSLDYRQAPEHPFPAPLDDCHAGWMWSVDRTNALGVDPGRIVLGGGSAGGGLAASLVQRLHDEGGTQPVGQLLLYPMLDDRTAARRELDRPAHRVWHNRSNRYGWTALLGTEPGGAVAAPYAAAARREDLAGLPPAWITVGSYDLFREEDADYAARLADAGVEVAFDVVPGAPHGFDAIAPQAPTTERVWASAREWVADVAAG